MLKEKLFHYYKKSHVGHVAVAAGSAAASLDTDRCWRVRDCRDGLHSITWFVCYPAVQCVVLPKSAEPIRLQTRMLWLLESFV